MQSANINTANVESICSNIKDLLLNIFQYAVVWFQHKLTKGLEYINDRNIPSVNNPMPYWKFVFPSRMSRIRRKLFNSKLFWVVIASSIIILIATNS
jgi:hypothetical protein